MDRDAGGGRRDDELRLRRRRGQHAGEYRDGPRGGRQSPPRPPTFLAYAEAGTLIVINQAAQSFTTRLGAVPTASVSRSFDVLGPVAVGDLWTVTLTSQGVPVVVTAKVTNRPSWALVANLASQINGLTNYRAKVLGTTWPPDFDRGCARRHAFVLTSSAPSGTITEQAVTDAARAGRIRACGRRRPVDRDPHGLGGVSAIVTRARDHGLRDACHGPEQRHQRARPALRRFS
jgi:hypothetical protein